MEIAQKFKRWLFWAKVGPPLFLAGIVLMAVLGAAVSSQDGALASGIVSASPSNGTAATVGSTGNSPLAPYQAAIMVASKDTGVEPELIEAVIMAESQGDPTALSPVGAMGLMQLMPDTAKAEGVDPWDPAQNILGGTRHLAGLLKAAPTWPVDDAAPTMLLAIAAYNAGEGAVQKYHGIPPYPETQGYVVAVMHYYELFKALAIANAGEQGTAVTP